MDKQYFVADKPGERADQFLARTQPAYSRSFWRQRCLDGHVTRNDSAIKPSTTLNEGDRLVVLLPNAPNFQAQTVPILYEDADVLVLDKPAGLLTHAKGALTEEFSIAEFIRPLTSDGAGTNRPGIVHRLDRGTSGVIITAKNPEAKRWLQKQFSLRKVKKNVYRAC